MAPLDAAAVAAVDTSGQLRELLDLPEHLTDALWRVDSAGIQRGYSEGGLVICGMGGAGAGGVLARDILGDRERRPVVCVSDTRLPAWVDGTWTVLLCSYSGTTDETLACWDAATKAGARRIVASTGGPLVERARAAKAPVIPIPGGFLSRHAIGYFTVIALEVARLCGAAPPLADEVTAAAEALRPLRDAWGADGPEDADPKQLARALGRGTPVAYGAGPTTGAARRLAAQLTSNAGRPAFSAVLPAALHDGVAGWADEDAPLVGVHLVDAAHTDAATVAAFDTLDARAGGGAVRVEASGASPAERVLRLVHLGDLATVYLAVLEGRDPAG